MPESVLDRVATLQRSRQVRARRADRHGDRFRDIGVEHSRAIALLPMRLTEPGGLERYFADSLNHRRQADRAFALSKACYARATCILLGIE